MLLGSRYYSMYNTHESRKWTGSMKVIPSP